MKVLVVIILTQCTFLSSILCDHASKPFHPKDYTYLDKTKSFYKIHTIYRNWFDAKTRCEMEGASLWYPEGQDELHHVTEFWKKTQPSFDVFFIGINDFDTKRAFKTIDGRPLLEVFHQWDAGEPNDGDPGGERCVILKREGVLHDHLCALRFPFVCKMSFDSLCSSKCEPSSDSKSVFRKDYNYMDKTKRFYKFHTIQTSWFEAKATCDNEEATLWYPEEQTEVDSVISFWNETQPLFQIVFIGINDLSTKGMFQTIDDGRSVDDVFNHWAPGEPNDGEAPGREERCLILKREGVLHDHQCGLRFPFVCKKTLDSLEFGQVSKNVFRKDYTYLDKTRSFYKIHTIRRTWFEAKTRCEMEESSLWYPENQAEAVAVIAFWTQTQPSFVQVFIGVTDLIRKGDYQTVDGRSLDDVFNYWAPGEPNDGEAATREERCLILRRQGDLHDHQCGLRFPFICKKTFDSLCNSKCNIGHHPQVSQLFIPVTSQSHKPSRPSSPLDYISSITTSVRCGVIAGGNDRKPLIYNGLTYTRGEWPWVVAIYRKRQSSLSFICSGTLVSDRHVVTAAHCMYLRDAITSKKDIVVKVGVHNLEDWGDDITVQRNIASAVVHENYNSTTLANDILVLTFDRSVEFNNNIKPACLWNDNPDLSIVIGSSGVVAGWGQSEVGPVGEGEPRLVRLPVVTTKECRASRPDFHKLTNEFTFCAGDRNGAGPCNGDSGGGFYMLEKGRWKLRGIVSLSLRSDNGDNTCNLNEYIIFTDAAKYVDWIRNVITARS